MKQANPHKVKTREVFLKVNNLAKHVNDKILLINHAITSQINN